MKVYSLLIVLFLYALLQSFCKENNNNSYIKSSPPPTTLDSLQGQWVSTNDSTHFLEITGRVLNESYVGSPTQHEHYRLYFSDTLIAGEIFDFSQVNMDTTATKGNFLIKVDVADGTFWCYKMDGFYRDSANNTILSISDTWVNKRPSLFRKQ